MSDGANGYQPDPLQRLIEIEAIKQLKARYWRLLDTQEWDEWQLCFTEDCKFSWPHDPAGDSQGAAQFVAHASKSLTGGRSVHHGHSVEIEITGPTTATAIWALADFVEHPPRDGQRKVFSGAGHYYDQYVKQDGEWKIASTRLERLRLDTTVTKSTHLAT